MANGHGGARPGGGRPSLVDENLRKRVIEKSWAIVEKFYDDKNEEAKDKLKVASYLAGKSVPQDVNLGGQLGILVEELHRKANEYKSSSFGGVHAS